MIAGQSQWERQIEKPIKLLNHLFEARRGFKTAIDACRLRQEDLLNQISLDRNFLLFLQAGKGSILPAMIMASKE